MPNMVPAVSDLTVSMFVTSGAQTAVNVINYIGRPANAGNVDLDLFVAQFDTEMTPLLRPMLPSSASVWGYKAQVYPSNPIYRPSFLKRVPGATSEGTSGDGLLPTQCSVIISTRTNASGRKAHGRIYLPFLPLDQYDGDVAAMNAAYATKVTALSNELMIINVASSVGPQIFNLGLAHRSTLTMTQVVLISSSMSIATQRRRGSYGKANRPPF